MGEGVGSGECLQEHERGHRCGGFVICFALVDLCNLFFFQ